MCFLRIQAHSYARNFEVSPDEVDNAELMVEDAVSLLLIDLFEEAEVDKVTVLFSPGSQKGMDNYSIDIRAQYACDCYALPLLLYPPCSEWQQKLAFIHPDDLLPFERETLKNHVKSCPACAACLGDYHILRNHIRGSNVPGAPTSFPLQLSQIPEIEAHRENLANQMPSQDVSLVVEAWKFPEEQRNFVVSPSKYRLPHMRSTVIQGAKPQDGHKAWHELAVACTKVDIDRTYIKVEVERRLNFLLKELFGQVELDIVDANGCPQMLESVY